MSSGQNGGSGAVRYGEYAYFVAASASPGVITKIDLATFEQVDSLTLAAGETPLGTPLIYDGHLYVGTRAAGTNKIVKVSLASFTRVGALTLNAGDGGILQGCLDGDQPGISYWCGREEPDSNSAEAAIVKVDLDAFTRVDSIDNPASEDTADSWHQPVTAVYHDGHVYVHANNRNGVGLRVLKIRTSDFTLVDLLDTSTTALYLARGMVLGYEGPAPEVGEFTYLYCATGSERRIAKIALDTFTVSSSLQLSAGEEPVRGPLFDPETGYLYVGTSQSPGEVVRVDTSDFTRLDSVATASGENLAAGAFLAPSFEVARPRGIPTSDPVGVGIVTR